jgi:hypothetical protein
LTINQAQELFKDNIYILHTSSGNLVDKPEKGGAIERFRIILPFEPRYDNEPYFTTPSQADSLYSFLKWKFPLCDPLVFGRNTKYYPFAGEDRTKYRFICHPEGKYISFSLEEIKAGINQSKKDKVRIRVNETIERKRIEQEEFDAARQLEQNIEYHNKTRYNITTNKAYYSPTGEEYMMPD